MHLGPLNGTEGASTRIGTQYAINGLPLSEAVLYSFASANPAISAISHYGFGSNAQILDLDAGDAVSIVNTGENTRLSFYTQSLLLFRIA
jgi:hypothetical protein